MTRLANNNDFNKDTRHILMKIDIYLDGDNLPPLVVDRENYLISATLLEETGADSSWPLGEVSSNELTFQMYSHQGLFCPVNSLSPYYGKIKARVKVRPYFKPADDSVTDWIPMGVFYVTDWKASITGIVASIVCHDVMRGIFKEKPIELFVKQNTTYKAFYEDIFNTLGIECSVGDYFNRPLPWAYTDASNAHILQSLAASDLTICNSNREGIVEVKHIGETVEVKDLITDDNQIKDADTTQSISKTYDGISLTYGVPQTVKNEALLNVQNIIAPPGTFTHEKIKFSYQLMTQIKVINLSAVEDIRLVDFKVNPFTLEITTHNPTAEDAPFNIIVYGDYLEKVAMKMEDEGDNRLMVKNDFLQDTVGARRYKNILESFVSADMPTVDLLVRGNPLISLGDKLQVQSVKFRLSYVGRVRALFFKYDGTLEGNIKLVDNRLTGGV